MDELSAWPWPAGNGPAGFEIPAAKRRRIAVDERTPRAGYPETGTGEEEYIGSLPAEDVARYETRIDDIHEDMDDLNVEEIKRTVLNTHFSPKSRPSSSGSNAPVPSIFSNYTRMDDFTAVVTATVLQALPNLSRLMRLMDVWTVRLLVLRKVPPLLLALDDAEVALKSGWQAIEVPGQNHNGSNGQEEHGELERKTFDIMRDVLQDKVTALGQDLDYMLDTLEGRQDTLPEIWLDRMETIERDYGEWVVRGDRKVREGEWARMEKARKAEADRIRAEEAAKEAARLQAENERRARDEMLRLEQEEAARVERERKEAEEKLRLEQEAAAEAARQAELVRMQEEARIRAEEEAAIQEAERLRVENEERTRLEEEAAAEAAIQEAERLRVENKERTRLEEEAARLAELARKQDEDWVRAKEEAARQEAEWQLLKAQELIRLEQEAVAELAQKQEEERIRAEEEAAHLEAERQQIENEERLRIEREAAAELARLAELARKRDEAALRLKEREAADAEEVRVLKEKEASKAAEISLQQTIKSTEEDRTAPTPNSSGQVVKAKSVSPASALALGIGVAVTTAFLVPGNGEVGEPEDSLQREAPRDISQSINTDDIEPSGRHISSDHTKEESANVAIATSKLHTTIDNLSPLSPISKFAPFDGSGESKRQNSGSHIVLRPTPQTELENRQDSVVGTVSSSPQNFSICQRPETLDTNSYSERPSTPRTPSSPAWPLTPLALASLSNRSTDGPFSDLEEKGSPSSPSKLARLGHGIANMLRRTSSSTMSNDARPQSSGSQPRSPSSAVPTRTTEAPKTPTKASSPAFITSIPARASLFSGSPPLPLRSPTRERIDHEWVAVDPSAEEDGAHSLHVVTGSTETSDADDASSFKAYNRNISHVSGYSTSDPTPEIQEAEPAEYFRPVLSPIKYGRSPASQPTSPTKSPLNLSHDKIEHLPNRNSAPPTLNLPTELSVEEPEESYVDSQSPKAHFRRSGSEIGSDGAQESVPRSSEEFELEQITPPVLARKTSIARIHSPIKRINIPRRGSTASDTSTIINRQPGDAAASPISPSSPLSELGVVDTFPDVDDESPSKGRVRSRVETPGDRSASGSPPPIPAMSPRRSFQLPKSPSFTKTEPESPDVPSTPSEAPVFDNIDLSEASVWSSPKKSTDDQIQAQISSLLESIPARIRLTSEPDITPFPLADTLRPAKIRRSITPSLRSHSSLSTRAPTPSFTLAPAYGKGASRPRHQNGNPQIKLYHLSRSTGEAPIKLFVRLVGENGERVMVRVGGGWADLGEYLREYASHHGRRSGVESDKVEVQDIRSRVVSTSSTASSATIRGNGRSSPISRPESAFDRPMSSLHIRKTRRSIGETDSTTMTFRSPSTPMAMTNRGRDFETPPSEKSRSSSRLSWTEEEGGLGLAGPKAKKVAISDRDQEWVESMKEKVRLASAEKEKKEKASDRDRKSLGEMDRVGATKRLFRKG